MNWCHVCLFYICEEISKHFHLKWSDLISSYQFLHQVVLLSKSVVQENTLYGLGRYLVTIGHILNYYHYQSQGWAMVLPWWLGQYTYDYQGQPSLSLWSGKWQWENMKQNFGSVWPQHTLVRYNLSSQGWRMERRGHWGSCQISVFLVNVSIWNRSLHKAHFTDPAKPLNYL